ncbi:hypothetical protein FHY02_004400 [Sphingomonas sp. BK069]|nr:hypothetical protein [Sphingomonas sp. BK069]
MFDAGRVTVLWRRALELVRGAPSAAALNKHDAQRQERFARLWRKREGRDLRGMAVGKI